jgi:hypothetical protein
VGYWIHGVTILHEEGTRNADEAGASGSPSDKGLGLSSCSTERGPCSRSFDAAVHLGIRLSTQSFARAVVSYVRTFTALSCSSIPHVFCFAALGTCKLDLVSHEFPVRGDRCKCRCSQVMFHTALHMYSQTPFSIFEPFYGVL